MIKASNYQSIFISSCNTLIGNWGLLCKLELKPQLPQALLEQEEQEEDMVFFLPII